MKFQIIQKSNLIFILIYMCFLFDSCKNDEPQATNYYKISGTVRNCENINGHVDSVYVVYNDKNYTGIVLAKSLFQNGGFNLLLPITITDNGLNRLRDIPNDITISDTTALGAHPSFLFFKNGINVGGLQYVNNIDQDSIGFEIGTYLYINKAISIKGFEKYICYDSIICTDSYDVSLKKGWNLLLKKRITKTNYDISSNKIPVNFIWESYMLRMLVPQKPIKQNNKLLFELFK